LVFYLLLLGIDGLAALNALDDGLSGEATLTILNDHLVTESGPLGGAADNLAGVGVLLELGEKGPNLGGAEDVLGFLLQALLLDATDLRNLSGGDLALATDGRVLDLVSSIQKILGDGALAGALQIGELVASLGSAETAETTTVDGGAQNNDLLSVGEDGDHVGDGRLNLDEVIGGLLDDGDDLVLGVLDGLGLARDGDLLTVDLNLLLGGEDLDLLVVEQDGDDLN